MNQNCQMSMTSVSGHLLNYEFDQNYRKWHSCDPVELFDAPVIKGCQDSMKDIKVYFGIAFFHILKVSKPKCVLTIFFIT